MSSSCLQGQVQFGGGVSSPHSGIEFGWSRTCEGSSGGRKSLLFHIISTRPPKQPRMVRTFLEVHKLPRLAYALRCRGY